MQIFVNSVERLNSPVYSAPLCTTTAAAAAATTTTTTTTTTTQLLFNWSFWSYLWLVWLPRRESFGIIGALFMGGCPSYCPANNEHFLFLQSGLVWAKTRLLRRDWSAPLVMSDEWSYSAPLIWRVIDALMTLACCCSTVVISLHASGFYCCR